MPTPRVTCHMITTLDGRLLADRWQVPEETLLSVYDAAGQQLGAQGWMVGRTTMEHYLPTDGPAIGPSALPYRDRLQDVGEQSIGVCFDRQGHLRPESGDIDGDHLVIAVSEKVSDAHVAQLEDKGISVIYAGPDGEDIARVLEVIAAHFGKTHLLLEGGGTLNGAFLKAGLIDDTSTLVYPVVDGQSGVPAIYETAQSSVHRLQLLDCQPQPDGTVWMRHRLLYGDA